MKKDFPERVECRCADGTRLSVGLLRPEGEPRGVVLASHAMMVNARSLDRPMGAGFASTLAQSGLLVLVADLRGHGQSGTPAARGGDWSYDDLVYQDVPTLVALAQEQGPDLPLFIAGQSLMGHVAMAWLGQNPDAAVRGMVLLAGNVCLDHGEPSLRNRLRRRRDVVITDLLMALFGYFPARRLGMGTDDESKPYFKQLNGFAGGGGWRSRDGVDYLAGLAQIRTPILEVVGRADRYWCNRNTARAFLAPVPQELVSIWDAGRGEHGLDFDPGHMQVVTDHRCAPLWQEVADWICERV